MLNQLLFITFVALSTFAQAGPIEDLQNYLAQIKRGASIYENASVWDIDFSTDPLKELRTEVVDAIRIYLSTHNEDSYYGSESKVTLISLLYHWKVAGVAEEKKLAEFLKVHIRTRGHGPDGIRTESRRSVLENLRLVKPWQPETLLAIVDQVMHGKAQTRLLAAELLFDRIEQEPAITENFEKDGIWKGLELAFQELEVGFTKRSGSEREGTADKNRDFLERTQILAQKLKATRNGTLPPNSSVEIPGLEGFLRKGLEENMEPVVLLRIIRELENFPKLSVETLEALRQFIPVQPPPGETYKEVREAAENLFMKHALPSFHAIAQKGYSPQLALCLLTLLRAH